MRSRRESASRSAASAASRCTSARRVRDAIPRPARRWRSRASTSRTSSRARTCASASTTGPTARSATDAREQGAEVGPAPRGPVIVCAVFELPPVFLALAFVLVGLATYFLGRRNGAARTVRLPRDYYEGLDHLINDRFDHAAEIFARMAEADGDAAEIQFALGSLFRRRGGVDRGIAIHSRRGDPGGPGLADKAAFALALDYQSAGLMDRAERVLEELAASREYRRAALDHLVAIYEAQGDWAKALKVFHELPKPVQLERARVAAHYLCELAEHALLQGDSTRARTLLRQARTHQPQLPRADMLTARIAEQAGDLGTALPLYLHALETSPGLALEIIPAVLAIARQRDRPDMLNE